MFDLKQFVPVAMAVGVFLSGAAYAGAAEQGERVVSLSFSDGRPDAVGLAAVNEHLGKVGVRISEVPGAKQALPILEASKSRALDEAEHKELLSIFSLDRDGLLDEIRKAGRKPAVDGGGALSISEKDVPPYPKIYDMKALDSDTVTFLKKKFGRLHVNSADSGHGIDEVMTIVSGGPYTWFFVLQDNAVAKVRFSAAGAGQPAWRISYPGLVPHGGYFDAEHGLVVAHAHGPATFVMRYEALGIAGAETLDDNPWIDFSVDPPPLLEKAKSTGN